MNLKKNIHVTQRDNERMKRKQDKRKKMNEASVTRTRTQLKGMMGTNKEIN